MAKKSAAKTLLDKGVIKTKDIPAAPKTVRADDTPETKPTKHAKAKAAQDQFVKADKAGAPARDADEVAAEELRVQRAVRGF